MFYFISVGKNFKDFPWQVAKSCVSHLALNPWRLGKGLTTALVDCVVDGKLGFGFWTSGGPTREIAFQVDIPIGSGGQKLAGTARTRNYGQSQERE